jgi:hypothetical protein
MNPPPKYLVLVVSRITITIITTTSSSSSSSSSSNSNSNSNSSINSSTQKSCLLFCVLYFINISLVFQKEMSAAAATGTVTLSEIKSTTPKTMSDVHLYTQLVTRDNDVKGYFDTGLFYNMEEFTMRYNEQHKMLLQGLSFDKEDSTIYRARLVNDELTIDMNHELCHLCYAITLLTPDVTLTVGPKTSLSLLLRSAQLHITTYMVTEELATQLKRPLQERDLVRSQMNTIHQYAQEVLNTCWTSANRNEMKKRKTSFDVPSQSDRLYSPCSPTSSPPPSLCSTV